MIIEQNPVIKIMKGYDANGNFVGEHMDIYYRYMRPVKFIKQVVQLKLDWEKEQICEQTKNCESEDHA